jgi:hypothetical protein
LLELVADGDDLVGVAAARRHRSGDHVLVLRCEGGRGPEDGVAVEKCRQLQGDLSFGEEGFAGEVAGLDVVQADLYGAVSGLVYLW